MVSGESAIAQPDRGLRGAVSGYRGHRQLDAALATRPTDATSTISLLLGFPRDPEAIRGVEHIATTLPADPALKLFIDPSWQGLQIDLTPMGAGRTLGVPADKLAAGRHDLAALLGPEAATLIKKLSSSPTWQVRFDAVDRFLKTRLQGAAPRSLSVAAAWRSAAESLGLIVVTPASPVSLADPVQEPTTNFAGGDGNELPRPASGLAGW